MKTRARRKQPREGSGLPKLVTRQEFAHALGVCPHTVRHYELRGFVEPIRLSARCIRYRKSDVERLLERLGGGKGHR